MSTDLQNEFLQLPELKMNFYRLGSGSQLLFIHGHRSDALRYVGILEALANYAEIYAPDLPGCGKTAAFSSKRHTMKAYANILVEFIEELDLNDFILTGGSMGGIISLLLYPQIKQRVSKLVLLGTPIHKDFFSDFTKGFTRYRTLLNWAIKTKVVPRIGQAIINSDSIMKVLYQRTAPQKYRDEETTKFEIAQWRAMQFAVWMESNYDLLNLDLIREEISITVPVLVFESKGNQYYDALSNLEALREIAPQLEVIYLNWDSHVPRGNLSHSVFDEYKDRLLDFIVN